MNPQRNMRLEELEQRFSQMAGRLEESPEKEAISILHAMIQEFFRQGIRSGSAGKLEPSPTLEDLANLYKYAPEMRGKAEQPGLPPGTKAPNFTLKDSNGRPVSLTDYRGKNVVLAFYPLDWSPGCSDQLSLYQSEIGEFEKHNAQVIGVSVDSIYSHGAWALVRGISFPLLSDFHPKGEVARTYQVYRDSDGFAERALFVIDEDGVIRYREVSPELHMIPDVYELFDQLKVLEPSG